MLDDIKKTHILKAYRGKISVAHNNRGWRATFTPAGGYKNRLSSSYRPRVAEATQLLLERIHDSLEPGEYMRLLYEATSVDSEAARSSQSGRAAPSPRSQRSQRSLKRRRLIKDEMPMESETRDATCANADVLQECDDAEGITSLSIAMMTNNFPGSRI